MVKIKLIDVAEKAGVSKSTVSQYLNGRFDYMAEKTKQRIKLAIDALDYVPNPIARSLKTAKTKTIGVIVRDITGSYTGRAIRGIDDFCKKSGYNVLIYNTDFDPDIEAKSLLALNQLSVDGIIIASSGKNTELITKYIDKGLPIVQFQLEHNGHEKHIILSNYRQGAFDATDYLIGLGHKRICFITQHFENVKSRKERYQGYVQAHLKRGIQVDEKLIMYWQRETGFEFSPTEFLAQSDAPSAFFTQHLAITTALLKNLDQGSVSIPDDVSVISFDDIPMAEFFKVPITVIKQEPYEIGIESAKLLLNILNSGEQKTHRAMVPCNLIIRASCKSQ
jgi:DNA-binding LacI/PurR family transcriptional regulator